MKIYYDDFPKERKSSNDENDTNKKLDIIIQQNNRIIQLLEEIELNQNIFK